MGLHWSEARRPSVSGKAGRWKDGALTWVVGERCVCVCVCERGSLEPGLGWEKRGGKGCAGAGAGVVQGAGCRELEQGSR